MWFACFALVSLVARAVVPDAGAAPGPYEALVPALRQGTSIVEPLGRLLEAEERAVRDQLLVGSPAERRAALVPLAASTSRAITAHLHHAPDDRLLGRLVLRTLLRRKGRLVDVASPVAQTVRATTDDEGLATLSELVRATRRLASTDPDRADLADARREVDGLQAALLIHSRAWREVASEPSIADVAVTLAPRAYLLEFVRYRPWQLDTGAFGAARYALYTLDRYGTVFGVDLGPAAPIDESVRALRAALVGQRDVVPVADELRARLFGEMPWLIEAPAVVVAPDGMLGHVPFELVLSRMADQLFQAPRVLYATSGRERAQLDPWTAETSDPVAVFDVDYGEGRRFSPVRGSAAEGAELVERIPAAVILRGSAPTERAVSALSRPDLLHIASHCVLAARSDPDDFDGFTSVRGVTWPASEVAPDPPALGSGVALAGANAGDDVLTAEEWTAVDLRGTRLVVLSACDTGSHEISNGDGVIGLRRALVLAGAQAQLISLWRVDEPTAAAMTDALYTRLAEGATADDALRLAKRDLAAKARTRHPYHWAGFLLSGRGGVQVRVPLPEESSR